MLDPTLEFVFWFSFFRFSDSVIRFQLATEFLRCDTSRLFSLGVREISYTDKTASIAALVSNTECLVDEIPAENLTI